MSSQAFFFNAIFLTYGLTLFRCHFSWQIIRYLGQTDDDCFYIHNQRRSVDLWWIPAGMRLHRPPALPDTISEFDIFLRFCRSEFSVSNDQRSVPFGGEGDLYSVLLFLWHFFRRIRWSSLLLLLDIERWYKVSMLRILVGWAYHDFSRDRWVCVWSLGWREKPRTSCKTVESG